MPDKPYSRWEWRSKPCPDCNGRGGHGEGTPDHVLKLTRLNYVIITKGEYEEAVARQIGLYLTTVRPGVTRSRQDGDLINFTMEGFQRTQSCL